MGKYILQRLGMMVVVVLGISFIVFTIMNLTPGNPAQLILGQSASPEQVAKLEAELGLNEPFFVRYFDYITDMFQGEFGNSYQTKLPVFEEILSRFPTTLTLAAVAMFFATLIGVPVGVISAVRQYSFVDAVSTVAALIFASIPSFVLGLVLMLVFALNLHWLPATGLQDISGYILPAVTLSTGTMATLVRMTRSTMLEVLKQDYIRTARAKGAEEKSVILKHSLRNALLPIITVIGVDFGYLLAGTVVIESVFAISGIGSLLITSIRMKDTPVVMAAIMFVTIAYSLVNLLVDIIYAYIDPRIKSQYERA
ncbi:ABC transporter permease [Emergencia sp. 1XD21-10]|uniref:ABC transporter permease n=1 Tax=Emergencia sp. 1XD21-10 TaxID=2304569 RepID=UPI00137B79A2|nr:ABC transporter permease [Emergencia sp. 1XD21-10]MCI5687110.1 ABC transporter permease [Emergencia sp.]NCE99016.1 ABC transporter permease [Emergencia sp. 1XD21-10]